MFFCVDKKSFQEIVESFLACSDWPVHTNNHDICDDCWSITVSSVSSIDYLLLQQTKPIHHFVVSISLPWAFSSVLTHWKNVCCIAETRVLLWCLCSQSPHLCVWFVRGERGCKVAGFPHPIFQTRLRWVPRKKTIYFCYVYETLPPMFSFGTSMWLGAYKSKSQCNVVRLIRAKGNDKGTWFLIRRFKKMFVQKHKEPND